MNRHYKIFLLFAIIITTIFSIKLYFEKQQSSKIIELSIQHEAKSISNFLVAFRQTYQDIFIKNHIKLDKSNIEFLPVKTTNSIADIFSNLNTRVEVSTVSSNPRNPINKANKRQQDVINYFEKTKSDKPLFKSEDGNHYFFTALYISSKCLKCHGKKENAPKIIKDRYDSAYNYKLGDLRGIIEIKISSTKLSQILQQHDTKRTFYIVLILTIILLTAFTYAQYNKKSDQKIEKLYADLTLKNRELEESEHEVTLINENLLYQKNIFENLYQQSSDGIFIIKNGKFIDCNKAALELFNYNDRSEIIGENATKISPKYQPDGEESSKKVIKMINIAIDTGNHTFEWLNIKASGEEFWTEIVLTKMLQNTEFIIQAVVRDITKRKEDELALEELSSNLTLKVEQEVEKNRIKDQQMIHQSRLAQMGEMISMIAHQWRQPLGAITARTGALILRIKLKEIISPNELNQELDKINEYAQHLSSTINDFRGFFKNNKAKENITLEKLVHNTLDIVQTTLRTKNIKVITEFHCGKEFNTYSSELKQVILNILKNAEDILVEKKIKNPTITISTICDINAQNQILLIKDNAGGIPKDIISNIFDPYFSTKLEKDGTGLGLYMSKIIVEEHCGGQLTVSNDGDGAVFKIELNAVRGGEEDINEKDKNKHKLKTNQINIALKGIQNNG